MADTSLPADLTAASARKRRLEMRFQKVISTRGDVYSRKLIGGGAKAPASDSLSSNGMSVEPDKTSLQSWSSCSIDSGMMTSFADGSPASSTDPSSSLFPRSASAPSAASGHPSLATINALTAIALKSKFRRAQFRRLKGQTKKSKGSKTPSEASAKSSHDGDGDSSDEASSETSSSGTSSSDDDDDAMDAVIHAATSLLREEMTTASDGNPNSQGPGDFPPASGSAAPQGPGSAATTSGSVENTVPSQCAWPGATAGGLPGDHCPSNGVLSVCGRRREMEDSVSMIPAFSVVPCHSLVGCLGAEAAASESYVQGVPSPEGKCQMHLFSVFDGHGGSRAATHCSAYMAQTLSEELHLAIDEAAQALAGGAATEGPMAVLKAQWTKAMTMSFARMDAEISGLCYPRRTACNLSGECGHQPLAEETVGTTAVVSVLSQRHIITANCGDSRAVLSRGGQAFALSNDHKPDREDEMKRIEQAGGRVVFWNGYRVLGVLAMSRAIGDRYLKPYVIPEPEVTFQERSDEDECLILASDGLWDVINNETACDLARKCLTTTSPEEVDAAATAGGASAALAGAIPGRDEAPAALAAALLTRLALARGSSDNTSVVVVDLRKHQPAK